MTFAFSVNRCENKDDEEESCTDDQNQCQYDFSKAGVTKGCVNENSKPKYDLEYRFNVIDEMENSKIDISAKALKCYYVCKKNLCNSDANFVRVSIR